MSTSPGFNINRLRSPYENDFEWKMREEFLQAHRGSYPVHRLLCLSNCYINSRLYGCRYPPATMKELEILSCDLTTTVDKIMGVQKVKFVKAKENTKVEFVKAKEVTMIKFVKASEDTVVKQETTSGQNPIPSTDSEATRNGANDSTKTSSPSATPSSFTNAAKPNIPSMTKPCIPSTVKPSAPSISSVKSSFASQCVPKPVVHPPPKLKQNTQTMAMSQTQNNPNSNEINNLNSDGMSPIDQTFFELAQALEGLLKKDINYVPGDFLPIAAMKTKMVFSYKYKEVPAPKGLHKFQCCTMYDSIEIAEGEGGNKKKARHKSMEQAGCKLCKTFLKVVRLNPETQVLKGSDEYFPSAWSLHEQQPDNSSADVHKESNAMSLAASKKRKFSETSSDLSRFLLIEPTEQRTSDNAKAVLQRSADFNKALLEYEFHDEGTGVRCRVILEGHILVEYFGTGRLTAKSTAAEKALEGLRKMCWTIKVKQSVDSDEAGLSRDEIFGEIQAQVKAIPEDNKGRQLLMKMGWTGGGVGSEGNKGREFPVAEELETNKVIGRAGLGSSTSSEKEFRAKVVETLESYAKSGKQEDLMFTAEFTKEERAYIHQQSQKIGLKTQSRGSGESRYLTVSRRRSAFQLFNHLVEEGGSTAKYELVAPGQSSQT
ncbi:uncharacterized protein LOC110458222 [Mizuhopecten yessoensis]|uniref:uncharacterized protein LOC110458222 n=1 Tax=Mizuhopecten yessoensis TaxID=6573 RepID=UPI000B45AC87|nr:uncharacterized protein LOC110458222 [Mizuhopecten yessoensis]XP_021365511.1 uncharacterized protein LOC110458222 [Mizuhopecten yessoensis]